MANERAPEPAEVIRRALEARIAQVHVSLPVRVETYDSATQKVSCKPLVMSYYRDENDERQAESLPIINGVPVAFPQGGGYSLTFPIQPGDIGMVIWSELSMDRWLSGTGQEVDPGIDHRNALADGVYVPGVRPFGSPLAGVPADHAALGQTNGVRVHLRESTICIGDEDGSGFLALADSVENELQNISMVLNANFGPHTYDPGMVGTSQAKGK